MGRHCTVCIHPERNAIDAARLNGEPPGVIAERWGVSMKALWRHKPHMRRRLEEEKKVAEGTQPATILDQLRAIHARTIAVLDRLESRSRSKPRDYLVAIREARQNLELLARLLGDLKDGTTVNVYESPQWLALEAAVYRGLIGYPDARASVARSLGALYSVQNGRDVAPGRALAKLDDE
jgi:hypothetical protein